MTPVRPVRGPNSCFDISGGERDLFPNKDSEGDFGSGSYNHSPLLLITCLQEGETKEHSCIKSRIVPASFLHFQQ